ncbi:MAG: hypothetical protein QHC67_03575 [Sphingobium sp.]|uniref:hypothetical protein n=1 Tax=Sphingobium sp. TaxID=1912891 RepID=UPI0029ACB158|nr:hypothetical protein [Sphingobium sp.]MDX3908879.1 hypothetical protein [Sphingobium sp.]
MARIAGQIPGGWKAMAELVGKTARTVRRWGDDDSDEEINLKAAIDLDIAYQVHGGKGRPLYDAYGLLVKVAVANSFPDQFELLRQTGEIAHEAGEAQAALIRLALPDADDGDRLEAHREVLELHQKIEGVLPMLVRMPRAPP